MAGRSVSKQRQQEALKLLGDGYGCTELTSLLSDRWGVTRRTAQRHVYGAYAVLVADLQEVQAADMLAQLVNRLETVARKASEQGQHACVIGACKLLAELVVTPHRSRPTGQFGRFGRSSWG